MTDNTKDIKAVFKETVNARLTTHPNEWAGEDSAAVVKAVLMSQPDNEGNPITLSPEEDDIITLASRPTNEIQMRVIRNIVKQRKVKLDPEADELIKRVVGAGTFKLELVKAGKIKASAKGGLKDLLA